MKLSLIAAKSLNNIIGNGPDIPWVAKGEQLLFKALTYNQWLLVGRKTFESMGCLPNRRYAVISNSGFESDNKNVLVFSSIESALVGMAEVTDHLFVSGGGQIYSALIDKVDTLHLSTIHTEVSGDVKFPDVPGSFRLVFEQFFSSNLDYTYQIWRKQL